MTNARLQPGPYAVDNLSHWAAQHPEKIAIRLVDGEQVTEVSYEMLDCQANLAAQWLIGLGMQPGHCVALLMENRPEFLALIYATKRAGLYFAACSTHLSAKEINYVLQDSSSRILIATAKTAIQASSLEASPDHKIWNGMQFVVEGEVPGFRSMKKELEAYQVGATLPERPVGREMLYSSGTTGYPKGIKRGLVPFADRFLETYDLAVWRDHLGFRPGAVYLTMAPMYHSAPLRSSMRVIDSGGTCILTSRFDAAMALRLIEKYQVNLSQWVPTMMVRMLNLPAEVRAKADLSSMKIAIHAAAPCAPEIKRQMIDWWGPVWHEYYAGSEAIGVTVINSEQWLRKPGSVGIALQGKLHIKDGAGNEVPVGEQGRIYFSGCPRFEYHNDPEKTARAYDQSGCATYGDIGHMDEDGFLFISGRRTDLILSGGVNIYPQEIENLLITFPGVADVAVIGVPSPEFGEEVKAVVELNGKVAASRDLELEIIAFCRSHLSHVKCPRSVDFTERLPRHENGKLYKRMLIEQYAQQTC